MNVCIFRMSVYQVDQEHQIEVNLGLENYPGLGVLTIPPFPAPFTHKLKLRDQSNRRLQLTASITAQQGTGLKVLLYKRDFILEAVITFIFNSSSYYVTLQEKVNFWYNFKTSKVGWLPTWFFML